MLIDHEKWYFNTCHEGIMHNTFKFWKEKCNWKWALCLCKHMPHTHNQYFIPSRTYIQHQLYTLCALRTEYQAVMKGHFSTKSWTIPKAWAVTFALWRSSFSALRTGTQEMLSTFVSKVYCPFCQQTIIRMHSRNNNDDDGGNNNNNNRNIMSPLLTLCVRRSFFFFFFHVHIWNAATTGVWIVISRWSKSWHWTLPPTTTTTTAWWLQKTSLTTSPTTTTPTVSFVSSTTLTHMAWCFGAGGCGGG